LEQVGFQISDAGNVTVRDRKELEFGNSRLRYLDEIVRVNEEVARQTEVAIASRQKVIGLGGDHSINLGFVSGASAAVRGELGMIYLDAHGDINTERTTPSGNIHGMHLAALMGFGAPELRHLYSEQVKLPKENLLLVGGSDFDQAELELIKREQLQSFSLLDLLSQSLGPLLNMIKNLGERVSNIWVSMDFDVIDRVYAPGAGMPNAKGLTYREITTIAEYVGAHCHVIGADVVEYNPLQDEQNKTAELGIELIAKFFGKNYSWYTNYLDRNRL